MDTTAVANTILVSGLSFILALGAAALLGPRPRRRRVTFTCHSCPTRITVRARNPQDVGPWLSATITRHLKAHHPGAEEGTVHAGQIILPAAWVGHFDIPREDQP